MLKTADQIIGPGLDAFYVRRPNSFKFINERNGVYWHPFAVHRAQAARSLQRLVELVAANRLSAQGQELLDYIASEFREIPNVGPTFAEGEIAFTRPLAEVSGDIPMGTRFTRAENGESHIYVPTAIYETLAPVHFDVGQLSAGPVPIRAVSNGTNPNHLLRTDDVAPGVSPFGRSLFDPNITVSSFSAAGGSASVNDTFARKFAKAYNRGSHGPDRNAALYGALLHPGVRNVLEYTDAAAGAQRILVADASWASSSRWASAVEKTIYDAKLVGFGCRVQVTPVRNKVISAQVQVTVRDWRFTTDTVSSDAAIRAAAQSYFDDRPDWNIWKTRGLRNAITRSHANIMNCVSVVVYDVNGDIVPEIASADYTQEQFHYYLPKSAVTISYSGPT